MAAPYVCKRCGKEMFSLTEVVEYWDDIYCKGCNPEVQPSRPQPPAYSPATETSRRSSSPPPSTGLTGFFERLFGSRRRVSIGVTGSMREQQRRAQSPLDAETETRVDEIMMLISDINSLYRPGAGSADTGKEKLYYARLRSIGEELYQRGGMDLTQLAYYRVRHKSGGRQPGGMLNTAWNGIGDWYE